jgi:hypothetical protein
MEIRMFVFHHGGTEGVKEPQGCSELLIDNE